MTLESNPKKFSEHRKILFYYVIFFGSAAMMFIPLLYTSLIALVICILTLIGIYSEKSDTEEGGVLESHMTYLIHTFWYSSLFLLYSSIASIIFLILFSDYGDLYSCILPISQEVYASIKYGNTNFVKTINFCTDVFYKMNERKFLISGIIAFAPIILYLLFRFIKGWACAVKNQSVTINQKY